MSHLTTFPTTFMQSVNSAYRSTFFFSHISTQWKTIRSAHITAVDSTHDGTHSATFLSTLIPIHVYADFSTIYNTK